VPPTSTNIPATPTSIVPTGTKLPPTATSVPTGPTPTTVPITGNNYYVSPSGNDSNPGTSSQPWLTIRKAANTMVAGDTVNIHAGTYDEDVQPVNSGKANKYITYRAFGDGDVVIDGQSGTRTDCITVNNESYLTNGATSKTELSD
jgi:hypothetical protein